VNKRVKTKYNTEFRERAVKMVINSEKSTAQIVKDLEVKSITLYSWVNQIKSSNAPIVGQRNEQIFHELIRLKKELAEVKEQRDILKKGNCRLPKKASEVLLDKGPE
jgi:transposase